VAGAASQGQQQQQQQQQGQQPAGQQPAAQPGEKKLPPAEKRPPGVKPEVEKAEVAKPQEGKLRVALKHVSEHRFFYGAGTFILTLLILFSTNKLTARRIFGSICVLSILFLLHYLFIGIWLPKLPADSWRGPTSRSLGFRSVKEWIWVPEGNSVLSVIREKNWLGPKNKSPLTASMEKAVVERVKGATALEYGKGFVCNGVPWKNAISARSDGGPVYVWGAEFKQQRLIIILDQPGGAVQKDRSLQDILAMIKKIQ
jgi:hypothetical protein